MVGVGAGARMQTGSKRSQDDGGSALDDEYKYLSAYVESGTPREDNLGTLGPLMIVNDSGDNDSDSDELPNAIVNGDHVHLSSPRGRHRHPPPLSSPPPHYQASSGNVEGGPTRVGGGYGEGRYATDLERDGRR